MTLALTISGKILGRTKPLFSDRSFSLSGDCLALKDLLASIVRSEIDGFRTRQEERCLLKVLTPAEIEAGIARGKIDSGGRDSLQEVNEEEAIQNALQAFEDGFYYVFIDDIGIESLDSPVSLTDNSQILFLRLVPLVGG
jgi:hypothetical protein